MSVFGHGQLRLYLLALLREGPRHGYDVIRDLEQRFSGNYSPSAGTVYPRLAKLEEEGLVERTDEGRKATYRLTDAGRDELDARADEITALEESLDASASRLAEEMRRRVRSRAATLREEMRRPEAAAATAPPKTDPSETTEPGGWSLRGDRGAGAPIPGGVDLDVLIGGLVRGHVPDMDAVTRAARRWRDAVTDPTNTNVTDATSDVCNGAPTPSPGIPETSTGDGAGEPDEPSVPVDTPAPASTATAPDATSEDRVDRPGTPGGQEDHDTERPFPSPDQVREIVAILKDAGERIRRVLDRPRG